MPGRIDAGAAGSFRASAWVARATFAEVVRLRLAWGLGAGASLLLAAAVWLRDLHFGTAEIRFLFDLGFGAISLGATLLAVVGMAQLFFSDLDGRLVAFVLTRPVPRSAWLVGKLGGMLASLAWFCAFLGSVLAGLVSWRAADLGATVPWGLVFAGAGALWLKAAIAASATIFFCTYARTALFAAGAGMFFVLIGHLRPAAVDIPLRLDVPGVCGAIVRLWPDLARFEPASMEAQPGLAAILYGMGYVVVFASAAAMAFRPRDL